ncbi:MAG: glycosyltransferase family 10 [bacterium]|nr:glycosyltransferase family 10 [bacterium]
MKKIRIAYIDFWPQFDPETFLFTRLLRKHYDVELNGENPDFIFCSNTGRRYLAYSCPRIYFTGEAVCPDFNVYDYAIGFDRITFGDRYLYYPLCLLDADMMEKALHKHELEDTFFMGKKGFCSYVVSADGGVGNRRDDYFDVISTYRKVDSGGRHRNNLPDGKPVPDKLEFQKRYKFSLTCENSSFKGYATEKLVDAFAAGTIPIYWGDPDIKELFNEKAFISCADYADDEELVHAIREIDKDEARYLSMVHEPALRPDSPLHAMMEDRYLETFLVHIFGQDPKAALRRNSAFSRNGKFHEHDIYKLDKLETNRILNIVRNWKRNVFGTKKL